MTWQNRQLKDKVIIITELSVIPSHEGAWSTQRQSNTVIRVGSWILTALRLNYCCTTNIKFFALHVDIIIDQQSVMISNWSVIINNRTVISDITKYISNVILMISDTVRNINCWRYCISSPISWSLLKDETLKVGDLPTDSCCPPEKVKPLAISQERNWRLYN